MEKNLSRPGKVAAHSRLHPSVIKGKKGVLSLLIQLDKFTPSHLEVTMW